LLERSAAETQRLQPEVGSGQVQGDQNKPAEVRRMEKLPLPGYVEQNVPSKNDVNLNFLFMKKFCVHATTTKHLVKQTTRLHTISMALLSSLG
jgi:hypothetical protein